MDSSDFIRNVFQFKIFLAMKFTTQHDLYYMKKCVVHVIARRF